MSAAEAKRIVLDIALSVVAGVSGGAFLSAVEQYLRIICGGLTAISLVFLIAVNYERGTAQMKKWVKKKSNGQTNN